MNNRDKTEFISWMAIIVFLLNIVGPWQPLIVCENRMMARVMYFIFVFVMVMGVFVMADKINEIHRERQLERYSQSLEPHKNDIQFLKLELMELEARLIDKKIAVSYNMAKRELLKHMIKELEIQNRGQKG